MSDHKSRYARPDFGEPGHRDRWVEYCMERAAPDMLDGAEGLRLALASKDLPAMALAHPGEFRSSSDIS